MLITSDQLVEEIHDTPTKVVLVASGGGSRAIADLLEVPGGSRTLVEAVVPYSTTAMQTFLGGLPDEFCSEPTVRAMAMAAFHRGRSYGESPASLAGVACTASLVSDRPKRGPHRIHVALQNHEQTATWFLELLKGRRSRAEEERLAGRLILNVVAQACGVSTQLTLDLLEGEMLQTSKTVAQRPWTNLLLGETEFVPMGPGVDCIFANDGNIIRANEGGINDIGISNRSVTDAVAVFPGAFNPFHSAHRRMVELAQEVLHRPVAIELSILNVDKPPLDFMEIERRVAQFGAEQPVYLTRAATFEEKSRQFPGATFVVGTDTLQRIAAPRYYGDNVAACHEVLQQIVERGCRFLVFVRAVDGQMIRQSDIDLPESFRAICTEVSPDIFREDISSTSIRQAGMA
jgi:nicotinamide mononucleotide (NMN) deamidase PncC